MRNQLVGISGADTATYTYDAFGRRRSATVNGVSTSTLYDGWNPIQLQSGGVVVENRLYGLGLDGIYNRTRDSKTESFLTDALGSTLELRDLSQSQTVNYTYGPYGNTVGSVASSNTIKYTGREQDAGDLYYYRNRYFKPSTGRFISEDPIELKGGSNLYSYVGGNPVNFIDPLGLRSEDQEPGLEPICIECIYPVRGIPSIIRTIVKMCTKDDPPEPPPPITPERAAKYSAAVWACLTKKNPPIPQAMCFTAYNTCTTTSGPMIFPGYGVVQ